MSNLFTYSRDDAQWKLYLERALCTFGLAQCGACVPSCPPLECCSDWCKKCNSNLPPHKHMEDGCCLVKSSAGIKGWYGYDNVTLRRKDGAEQCIFPQSFLFERGIEYLALLAGKKLPPLADLESLQQFLLPLSSEKKGDGKGDEKTEENWNLESAMAFIEGTKAAHQDNKKSKKKNNMANKYDESKQWKHI